MTPEFSHRGSEEARARAIEEHFLGGPANLTREETIARAGIDFEQARRLWFALGFADVPDGVRSFAEADVEALQIATSDLLAEPASQRTREGVTRILGQSMNHLAEAQVEAVVTALADDADLVALVENDPDAGMDVLFELLLPVEERLQSLLVYAWKRHLTAAATRAFAAAAREENEVRVGVGFADLTGWTTLTRDMSAADLDALVDHFESTAFIAVGGAGARVVKVIGDEVMFTAPSAATVAEAALALVEAFPEGGETPPVHAGAAFGPALMRGGDVFGAVVNIASRCTKVARPGTVVVDRGLAEAVGSFPAYATKRLPPQNVRGYRRLDVSVLRRAPAAVRARSEA